MTPLHTIGNWIRECLTAIPILSVRLLFVGSLVLLLIWILRLPKQYVTSPVSNNAHQTKNLRPVAIFAIVIQIVIYCWL